jgi:L-asparaginase II
MPVSGELAGIPAVDVTRGERVESVHHVLACACDDAGEIVLHCGTIDVPVFLRSSAKPFIAAAIVASGAAERFGLDDREIAVMAASHAGEPAHVAAAASILAKIGAVEEDLQCGGDPPLRNNCSGKHAGILALARLRGEPFDGYLDAGHPVQREILAFCERAFGEPFAPDRIGVDGCGIPVFAVSLAVAARTFARFATLRGFADADRDALARVRAAMGAHPWMVAGSGAFDTDLMLAARGTIVAKSGAEGVHASAVLSQGIGLVVKVLDGAARARGPATIALLRACGALDDDALTALAPHAEPPVHNVAGRIAGAIRARPEIYSTLASARSMISRNVR